MSAKKQSMKSILKENDAFFTWSEKMYNYSLVNKKKLILIGAVCLVGLIVAIVWNNYMDKQVLKADLLYEKAYSLQLEGKKSDAVKLFEEIRTNYSGYDAAYLSGFNLMRLYIDEKQLDKAKTLGKSLISESVRSRELLKPYLMLDLAYIAEVENDSQTALDYYKNALVLSGNVAKPYVYLSVARLEYLLGNLDAAKTVYSEIIAKFPKTQEASMALWQLSKLNSNQPNQDVSTPANE